MDEDSMNTFNENISSAIEILSNIITDTQEDTNILREAEKEM